jgi:hypothetical protein
MPRRRHEVVAIAAPDNDFDFAWSVREVQTNQIISTFFFMDDAEEYSQFLENGGGFNGFTPAFMLNSLKLSGKNLDENFNRYFLNEQDYE